MPRRRGGKTSRRRTLIKRYLVNRDGMQCMMCPKEIRELNQLTVDHVIRRSEGGDNSRDNKWLLCSRCHVRVDRMAKGGTYRISKADKIAIFMVRKGYFPDSATVRFENGARNENRSDQPGASNPGGPR